MRTAAVSDLKAHLSAWLGRVRGGEEVVVTDRGHPVARLLPIPADDVRDVHVADLERQGLARVGARRVPDAFWDLPQPLDPEGAALAAVLREREEGR